MNVVVVIVNCWWYLKDSLSSKTFSIGNIGESSQYLQHQRNVLTVIGYGIVNLSESIKSLIKERKNSPQNKINNLLSQSNYVERQFNDKMKSTKQRKQIKSFFDKITKLETMQSNYIANDIILDNNKNNDSSNNRDVSVISQGKKQKQKEKEQISKLTNLVLGSKSNTKSKSKVKTKNDNNLNPPSKYLSHTRNNGGVAISQQEMQLSYIA